MKLWTLQSRKFADDLLRGSICGEWSSTPQNWRSYYRWMAAQWHDRIGSAELDVPIWCWHSCNGIDGACPTVGTFAMLMGDWNYYAASMTCLELIVPHELALLSSYSRWNEAIDDAMDRREDSIATEAFIDMFDSPLIKHDTDDIQAVVPRIESTWVVHRWTLPLGDSETLDWDMPCTAFPETPEPSDAPKSRSPAV